MKLTCDFTESEMALLCDVLMNTALNSYDQAEKLVNSGDMNKETTENIKRLFTISRQINDLVTKILNDLGVDN